MPQTKEYVEREKVIDHYLATGCEFTGEELIRLINQRLRDRAYREITSRSTFAADIIEINSKFFNQYGEDVIKRERRGRQFVYYYIPGFSIYNRELSEKEVEDIHNLITTIRRFKGMPQFSWMETLEAHFDQVLLKNKKPVVAFDDSYNDKAMKPFNALLDSIENEQVIDIEYRRFYYNDTTHYIINPYYLKQYGLRWYLLASFQGNENIYTFALDRIKDVVVQQDKEFEPTNVDFEHYYDDVVGVSHYGNEIEHVRIWVSPDELPYILTKPLHKSQKVESKDDNGAIISIDVIPNLELEQTILSYGDTLEVMEPVWLRLRLKDCVQNLLDIYNTPEPGL